MKIREVGADKGSYIEIEPGENVSIVDDGEYVGMQTHNSAPYEANDELWIFKRKRFLKAVAKALNVAIYDPDALSDLNRGDVPGYYR